MIDRRTLLVTGALLPYAARAADFPSRPVQVIVPYAAGGADTYIRPLFPVLEKKHGVQMVVDTVTGAGGTIGSARVKRATADGHMLLFCGSGALTSAPALIDNAPRVADFTPILNLTKIPYFVTVKADSPLKTGADLVDYVRRNPGKLSYGSTGTGSATHLAMEALAEGLKATMTHAPYAGVAAAAQALLGGHIDSIIGAPSVIIPQVRAGKLRMLASSGAKRFVFAPDVPTFRELGVDAVVETHFAFYGPKGTPSAAVDKLAGAIRDAAADPAYVKSMETQLTPVEILDARSLTQALEYEERAFAPLLASMRKK